MGQNKGFEPTIDVDIIPRIELLAKKNHHDCGHDLNQALAYYKNIIRLARTGEGYKPWIRNGDGTVTDGERYFPSQQELQIKIDELESDFRVFLTGAPNLRMAKKMKFARMMVELYQKRLGENNPPKNMTIENVKERLKEHEDTIAALIPKWVSHEAV